MCLHVNGEVILGADGLAAEGAGEALPLVQPLVVRQGLRLEETQVALLALGAHLQVRVWRRRKIFLPTQAAVNNLRCCGSGMLIPDPDFCPSRIPDPKTATKDRGRIKFVVVPFFVATNITKFKLVLFLNWKR